MKNVQISRTREDPAVRRRQIVDEAIRLIGRHGYHGFKIQALARLCGISNAGLLYYFGSKEKLLLALLDEIERREEEAASPLVALACGDGNSPGEAYAAMTRLLLVMVDRMGKDPELGRFLGVLQGESLESTHPAHGWFGHRESETLQLFERLVARWSSDPTRTARQLLSLMTGLIQQWLRADRGFDLTAELEAAIRLAVPPPAPVPPAACVKRV